MATAAAEHYFNKSLAPSTRGTYDTAIRRWDAYCQARGWQDHETITARRVADWLCELADQDGLSAGTIRAYKSALREHHLAKAGPGWNGPNPCDDDYVNRVIVGIARAKAELTSAKKKTNPADNALTPDIVISLRHRHPSSNLRRLMMYAAMALGVTGLLRPSELLGSPPYPERALKRSQLRFLQSEAPGSSPIEPVAGREPPPLVVVHLRVAKADQERKGTTVYVAAPFAIQALWEWCIKHGPWERDSELFALPGGKRLLPAQFLEHIKDEMTATGRDSAITLKAMRRGGASALAASGMSREDIAAAGHWNALASHEPYLTAGAQAARAVAIAKAMQPARPKPPASR